MKFFDHCVPDWHDFVTRPLCPLLVKHTRNLDVTRTPLSSLRKMAYKKTFGFFRQICAKSRAFHPFSKIFRRFLGLNFKTKTYDITNQAPSFGMVLILEKEMAL